MLAETSENEENKESAKGKASVRNEILSKKFKENQKITVIQRVKH